MSLAFSHGFEMHSYYKRMIHARWRCKVCGSEHSKRVDRNFCYFEFVCLYKQSCIAYIVRLNHIDCLVCPPGNALCKRFGVQGDYDAEILSESFS